MLPALPDENDASRRQLCYDDIMRLNGKQTIYQMMQLAERIKERGGNPHEPLWYKHEYLRRLDQRIRHRLESLRDGALMPDDLLVYGSRLMLELLQRLNFGRLEGLPVRGGEPVLVPPPRAIREYKFGGEKGPRPARGPSRRGSRGPSNRTCPRRARSFLGRPWR